MGGRFVVTALIAMTLLSFVLARGHDRPNRWSLKILPYYFTFPRFGRRSYNFGHWNIRHAVDTRPKGTGASGRQ
uniref:Uncharacterized protein n=1 Tax=Conus magus TaxID=6492 RepID=A0A5P8I101_CONMA|nr:hypothetical protein [Conus magus]